MPKNFPKKCAPISEGDHFRRIFTQKIDSQCPKWSIIEGFLAMRSFSLTQIGIALKREIF